MTFSPSAKMVLMKYYLGPKAPCSCSLRELPPDLPETLPFELVPENKHQIEEWLLWHCGSSAFNICETQK